MGVNTTDYSISQWYGAVKMINLLFGVIQVLFQFFISVQFSL